MNKKFTNKQKAFIDFYVVHKNATLAAKLAGYSEKTAKSQGQRLLTHVDVKAEIDKRLDAISIKSNVTAERVIEELAKIAFANSKTYFKWDEQTNKLVPADDMTDDDAAAVAEVQQTITKDGGSIKMKLHDKMKALEMLSRHLQLFDPDENNDDNDGINITFTEFPEDENSNRTAANG